jgi:glycosyltransferase involved in cell wall biosynthesis
MHEHWLVCPMHVLWKYDTRPCEKPDCIRCSLAFRRPPQLWRYTPALRRWLGHDDAFLSPSRFTLRMHRERGLAALPLYHLPYFLPGAADDDISPEIGESPRRPYFLFVGRLERIKGLQNVIEVFRAYDKADLLVAGHGEYGEELRARAAGLPHVRFLGRLSHAELRALYRGALASLVPSICYEVFGIVIIESFAMRTPVIAHDLGALPEVVEESGGGFTYRTADELVAALERFRTDPGLRDELGGRGYDAYRQLWSEEPHLRAYFGLLREIADRKGLVLPELMEATVAS